MCYHYIYYYCIMYKLNSLLTDMLQAILYHPCELCDGKEIFWKPYKEGGGGRGAVAIIGKIREKKIEISWNRVPE